MLSSLLRLESKIDRFLESCNDGRPVLLYGAGFAMPAILGKLERHGFRIAGICDSRPEKQGTRYKDRYDILGLDEAIVRHPDSTFVISSPKYFEEIYGELVQRISSDRVSDVDLECAHYFEAHEFQEFFSRHHGRLEAVVESLSDDLSRETLIAVIKAHLTGDRKDFQQAYTGSEDWYLFRSLLAPQEKSVYLDCGAYDGDTIRLFREAAGRGYERIYAFEPNQAMRKSLLDMAHADTRVELVEKGVSCREGSVSFHPNDVYSAVADEGETDELLVDVPLTTIDATLNGRRADIIKMDIEGAEFDALQGAEQTIRAHKPRLAICLYHKVDDMARIPELVLKYVPEYKLYIRHQSESCTDTILFAVAD